MKFNWITACGNLRRLHESVNLLQTAFENQSRRARLDEERFRIGRASTLVVIQAGDDATAAEINLRSLQVERALAAWKVRRLTDGFKSYLEKLERMRPWRRSSNFSCTKAFSAIFSPSP
jgi:outer membrane protein TolC